MVDITRRGFLKIIGLATTSATMGCSADSARKLLPYIIPAEDIIPGKDTWYATTCRECPAGCGMLAKNRDGRIIKVEGNPAHPVNRGALCPRGQASLHGLYNPDRFTGPQLKEDDVLRNTDWETGQGHFIEYLKKVRAKGQGERIVFITSLVTDTMQELITAWLHACGGGLHLMYEPLAYEPLRAANRIVFGTPDIPSYRVDKADFLISFGTGFLETWLSNVEYARRFATFHEMHGDRKNFFVYIGARRSMTAASADFQIIVEPDDEWRLAATLLEMLLNEAKNSGFPLEPHLQRACSNALAAFSGRLESTTVPSATLRLIAKRFLQAEHPLVLAGGSGFDTPQATLTAIGANLMNLLKPGSRELIDFRSSSSMSRTASGQDLKQLCDKMARGDIDLLLVHEANPVFGLPSSWKFQECMKQAGKIVSFSPCPDETTDYADLVLPAATSLESWGDYTPQKNITGLMQPLMGKLFDCRELGDILLQSSGAAGCGERLIWPDFFTLLQERWRARQLDADPASDFAAFWHQALQQGGSWPENSREHTAPALVADFNFSFPEPGRRAQNDRSYPLVLYPTIQFFDGRGANRPWLQELPDPVTQTTWGGWVEMHPQTAARLKVVKNDVVRLSTEHGAIEVPVLPIPSVPEGVVALPVGQGHTVYGRYATDLPANPLILLPPEIDALSGAIKPASTVTIEKISLRYAIANTDGSYFQEGRNLAQSEAFASYVKAVASGHAPDVDMPMPSGFKRSRDIYPAHTHKDFRWCMVVDLDRCIGCGACVVACYAENNVAIVGREQILKQREMSWLRIQRYFDGSTIRYLPMLCQHCDEAPCESVCPIFAPQHSAEGLNNQVYNRCFGTRFCSQNDPYKVRRFNWFTFTRPTPLDWQLNPDVTVRQKGVMEKCSFCVQRIVAAKLKAKIEGRKLGDGEFTTACAQTCPVDALTFGSLKDPDSRVSQLINDPRAYQVLRYLNTKPAVIYLKKLTQEL
jgi:anaerobic selenocysteine-containing dehydrogenase/Fe-S-cluster-containing dehydrogenase component